MEWVKQNVALVVSIAVAVALMGAAGWFFYSKIAAEQEVEGQLTAAQQTLNELQSKTPFPNQENLAKVLDEQKLLLDYRARAEKYFQPIAIPKITSNSEFNSQILQTIYDLQTEAQANHVGLPTNFAFGFSVQRNQLQFDTNSLSLVANQLADIKMICRLLYRAKVYDILGFRRTAVAPTDKTAKETDPTIADYLASTRTVTTNDATKSVIYPYEASFKSSSAELATALQELAQSSNGFIVKAVTVAPWEPEFTEEGAPTVTATAPVVNPYSRYGGRYMMSRYRMMPEVTAPVQTNKLGTVLQQKPLKISLLIYAVKLQPVTPASSIKP